tara:strand:+ start:153 stop:1571 length:1419 start_codon:yes stop_codon:yes gene_type:complete
MSVNRILVAITADNYVRNYLRTEAFSVVCEKNHVDLIADESLALSQEVEGHPQFAGFYRTNSTLDRRHHLVFSIIMWRNRKKSPTFTYRWMRNSGWDNVSAEQGAGKKIRAFLKWLPGAFANPLGIRILLLGNPLIFPLAKFLLLNRLPINESLASAVKTNDYDLLVFPSAAFDSVSVDLTRLGKSEKITTLCLVDNWDNLTSKTSFWAKPDYLGVWGEQAIEQAHRIHGFSIDQVRAVGTPRFDSYFSERDQPGLHPIYPFHYLLFVGSAMPFDEIGALHTLERAVEGLAPVFNKLTIVYRPHPWQQKRRSPSGFREEDFSRTVLDRQIAEAYAEGIRPERTETRFQPKLDYYPRLFQGASVVIGPLTTMLFEGALALKPVIGLAYSDGHHANTSRRYFSHFDGVEKIPGFLLCEDKNGLQDMISESLLREPIDAQLSDQATRYFLHRSPSGYPEELGSLVSSIQTEIAAN